MDKSVKNKIEPLKQLLLEKANSDESSESEIELSETKKRPDYVSF